MLTECIARARARARGRRRCSPLYRLYRVLANILFFLPAFRPPLIDNATTLYGRTRKGVGDGGY